MSDATAGQQTTRFDREKANEVLQNAHLSVEGVLDALAECVRPVEGVTLTREEIRIVRWLLMFWGVSDEKEHKATPPSRESINALADRLGPSQ